MQPSFGIQTTAEFDDWLHGLADATTRIRLARRLDRASQGQLGDVKAVGASVWEMREFFGSGWRMYFMHQDKVLIVMLGGGDKSTQSRDIARAQELARLFKESS